MILYNVKNETCNAALEQLEQMLANGWSKYPNEKATTESQDTAKTPVKVPTKTVKK